MSPPTTWSWTSRRSSGETPPPVLALSLELNDGRRAEIRFTERREGNFEDASPERRASVAEGRWTQLHQQHGAGVVIVTAPGEADGAAADAAATTASGAVLTVRTADCAPVALVAAEGVVAAVHAGWRGLAAGVVEAAAAAVRRLGGRELRAYLGPCIHPGCYEFGSGALEDLARSLGPDVVSQTAWDTPAFDIPAAARAALRRDGIGQIIEANRCTACEAESWYSHRARGETGRHVMATWISAS
ncbi:MAG: laccase domain-containing protein [bacterium]|nr:laccase domain-containing protein [bacterium]